MVEYFEQVATQSVNLNKIVVDRGELFTCNLRVVDACGNIFQELDGVDIYFSVINDDDKEVIHINFQQPISDDSRFTRALWVESYHTEFLKKGEYRYSIWVKGGNYNLCQNINSGIFVIR